MAEIILPPEGNEETPQVPELNIDKPTENSKVITIEFEAKKTNKVSTKDTNQQLYTTDTDAWFEFKETSLEGANGTYSVVFRNRHDGSIFQRTGDVVNGVAYYKIPHQEIRHAGAWRGQIVYMLSNGDTTSREFGYDVKGHILDGKDVREIVVEDFETLMSQLRSMKDNAEQELAGLVNTANQNETDRQVFFDDLVDDIDGLQANYQELLDTGVLQTNINNKLEALEEEYAPKLTEVTAQLAQSANQLKPSWSVWEEFEQRTINVKWFGAKADGVTDDRLAFQSAVDFAHSIGGATVYMPRGIYMIKSGIQWKSNVSLKGDGAGKSIFVVEGMFSGVIVDLTQPSHGTGTNFLENCSFEDFEIDGSGYTFTDADIRGKGLFILYMRRARFRNLYLHDTVGTALGCDFLTETVIDSVVVERAGRLFSSTNTGGQSGIGIGTNALEDETVIVSNCHTIDCGNYGIFIETQNKDRVQSRHTRIINCVSKGNRFGIGNKGAGGTLISGCSIYENTDSGIVLNEHSNGDQIIGNKIEKNKEAGITVDGSYDGDLSIIGNHISKNEGHGIRLRNNLSGNNREHILISENRLFGNGYSGVAVEGNLFGFIISNNEIFNNGQKNASNNNLGIGISNDNGKGSIVGNLIYDTQELKTQAVGIKITTNTSINADFIITNNNLPGYNRNTGIALGTGQKNDFILANNSGLIYEEFGTVTIPDGQTFVTINHSLGKTPTVVAIPSNAFGQIRVDGLSTLSFTIRRPLAENTGDLVVNWSAKVNPL